MEPFLNYNMRQRAAQWHRTGAHGSIRDAKCRKCAETCAMMWLLTHSSDEHDETAKNHGKCTLSARRRCQSARTPGENASARRASCPRCCRVPESAQIRRMCLEECSKHVSVGDLGRVLTLVVQCQGNSAPLVPKKCMQRTQ